MEKIKNLNPMELAKKIGTDKILSIAENMILSRIKKKKKNDGESSFISISKKDNEGIFISMFNDSIENKGLIFDEIDKEQISISDLFEGGGMFVTEKMISSVEQSIFNSMNDGETVIIFSLGCDLKMAKGIGLDKTSFKTINHKELFKLGF
jgi:hypothetical protein